MVHLPWPLEVLMFVRVEISEGRSVRSALDEYLQTHSRVELNILRVWYLSIQNSGRRSLDHPEVRASNSQVRTLLQVLERGVRGEAILPALLELERDFLELCDDDLERFASRLPTLIMGTTALFLFPAFVLILIGPLLADLMRFN